MDVAVQKEGGLIGAVELSRATKLPRGERGGAVCAAEFAMPGTTDKDERSHPKGQGEDRCQQEEVVGFIDTPSSEMLDARPKSGSGSTRVSACLGVVPR